jgi:hypothetical protein
MSDSQTEISTDKTEYLRIKNILDELLVSKQISQHDYMKYFVNLEIYYNDSSSSRSVQTKQSNI